MLLLEIGYVSRSCLTEEVPYSTHTSSNILSTVLSYGQPYHGDGVCSASLVIGSPQLDASGHDNSSYIF